MFQHGILQLLNAGRQPCLACRPSNDSAPTPNHSCVPHIPHIQSYTSSPMARDPSPACAKSSCCASSTQRRSFSYPIPSNQSVSHAHQKERQKSRPSSSVTMDL